MLILMPLSLPVLHFEVLFVMFIAIGIFFSPALRVQNYPADTNPSTYQRVTAINPDGSCVSVPQVCDDGTIAPFDEELSLHFRGPIHINQIAFYLPSETSFYDAYDRVSYYSAPAQILDNLVFLGPYGGEGSGVFDLTFGPSLAYVSPNGTGGSSTPQILADTLLPTDAELVVMMDEECAGEECGFVRPGGVAYHGFPGASKVILLDVSFPKKLLSTDMPTIWLLNAHIPRTALYGSPGCTCRASGCGELDVLGRVASRAEGRSMMRGTGRRVKIALVFDDEEGLTGVFERPEGMVFVGRLDGEAVAGWGEKKEYGGGGDLREGGWVS